MPDSIAGWVGLGLYCVLFLVCLGRWWDVPLNLIQKRWQLLVFLFFSIIPASLFLGIGENNINGIDLFRGQYPGMVVSAIPWFLISAYFGPVLGGLAGLLSGLIQALLSTNSAFTPFVLAISGCIAGACFRQKYRGDLYNTVRHPLGASGITALIAYLLCSVAAFADTDGSLAAMVNAGLQNWKTDLLFAVLPILIAGVVGEFIFRQKIGPWRKTVNLLPSPDEGFAESKFWRITLPVVFLFIFVLAQISWDIQTRQVKDVLESSMSSHASQIANTFTEQQKLLDEKAKAIAVPGVLEQSTVEFYGSMQKMFPTEKVRISVIDAKSLVLQQFPETGMTKSFSAELLLAIKSGLEGDGASLVTQHPWDEAGLMTLNIVQPILDPDGKTLGVMVLQQGGLPRQPDSAFWAEVTRMEMEGGLIWVVPTEDRTPMLDDIPAPDLRSQVFPGEFVEQQGWKSTASYAYWPASKEWTIFVKIPSNAAANIIMSDFIKQMIFLMLGFTVLLILLNIYWINLFHDEQRLLQAARQISRGNYAPIAGLIDVSEMMDISQALEQIRVNVKAQMDEAHRLISIGRGVAVREEFGTAVEPILQAALRGDATCARVILVPPKMESVIQAPLRRFGFGDRSDAYAVLDNQVLEICKREGIFVIRNTARSRRIDFNSAVTIPASIVGLPIYLEKDDFLGVLWIGYEKPQVFPDEEITLLKTLASEIAVAAAGERRLSETEQGRKQFEALVDSIQDPLLLLDQSGEVIFANEAAQNLNGLILRDENGKRIAALPSGQKSLTGIPIDPGSEGIVKEVQLADGRIYSARFTPFETDGRFTGSMCLMRDVHSYADELSRKGEFVETVSHDLRQPLTMISGYANMIQMLGETNDQQRLYLQKILGGLETMGRMVNNILDLSRVETGTRLHLEKVDARLLVTKIVDEFAPQAAQKKIVLTNKTTLDEPLMIDADSELLHQAIINIVDNAIKFTGMDGKVNIWVEKDNSRCIIHIQDTGIGISPIDLPGLFNRAGRSSIREAGQRASKLGLIIVKSIVELHGGEVHVESQLGKGSKFSIEIPI